MKATKATAAVCLLVGGIALLLMDDESDPAAEMARGRQEVVFWHFWGGEDEQVVQDVVARFNASQDEHFVRAVTMPGNNLDVKLFLAVTGGDPPDLINQDDPIIADWAFRGALTPLDEIASPDELRELDDWLFAAARRLCQYDGRTFGVCNGLDIRALYYNRTLIQQQANVGPPRTPDDLLTIAERLSLVDRNGRQKRFGFLPDSRRLWAWGIAFGGQFFDPSTYRVTADDKSIVAALDWMAEFSRRFGPDQVAAFRQDDQRLPGASFPLLATGDDSPHGRYAVILDGQWRVRDIARSQQARRAAGLPVAEYGVWPLPFPTGGRERAGWVNGNFFLVPRGAKNQDGAWAFMKFWIGFRGSESEAAETCIAGGWIPVSQSVVDRAEFRQYLQLRPLFREFVKLAASQNQYPIPVVPGAPYFDREIRRVGSQAMRDPDASAESLLSEARQRIQDQLNRVRN